jgi:hypothetical protein
MAVESQLTAATGLMDDLSSDTEEEKEEEKEEYKEEEEEVESEEEMSASDDVNAVDDVVDDNALDDDGEIIEDGGMMHGFSSGGEFSVNERCAYYMDRVAISKLNRFSVEVVFMIEAETLCRNENTMKLPELQAKIYNRYKSLINAIPAACFSDYSLKEAMMTGIKNSKGKDGSGSAKGLYLRTREAKKMVQAIVRQIPTLSKLPSGKDIIDVRNAFILKEYKAEKGEVSSLLFS